MTVSLLKLNLMVTACSYTRMALSTNTTLEGMYIHSEDGCILWFICSSKDYTSSFGLTDQEGSFTPNIHDAFNRYSDG